VNIVDNKDGYRIEVAAPGLKKEDFKVNMDGNILTVFSEKETRNEQYARREFSYSSFRRSFNLPEGVEPNDINASYKDGILAVEIPKKDDAKKREIKQISIR
jgi:HSP20 family protein